MSHYRRGVLEGVVHYCDGGWWPALGKNTRDDALLPWCLKDFSATKATRTVKRAEPVIGKHAMVTCFLCLGLRRKRP